MPDNCSVRYTLLAKTADGVARDFSAYSVLFDGQPVAVWQEPEVAPNVKLIRRC